MLNDGVGAVQSRRMPYVIAVDLISDVRGRCTTFRIWDNTPRGLPCPLGGVYLGTGPLVLDEGLIERKLKDLKSRRVICFIAVDLIADVRGRCTKFRIWGNTSGDCRTRWGGVYLGNHRSVGAGRRLD